MPRDVPPSPPRWELAAEAIVVKIRWFGLLLGYLSVNLATADQSRLILNAILAFGAGLHLIRQPLFVPRPGVPRPGAAARLV